MKNIYIKSSIAAVALMLFSCQDDTENLGDETGFDELSGAESESGDITYNLLDYTPNVYHEYFTFSDKTVGFSSIKSNPLGEHFDSQLRSDENPEIDMEISINGNMVSGKGGERSLSKANIDGIYGRDLSISITPPNGKTFKNGDTRKDVKIYIPEKINISNPKVSSESEQLPYCYSEDFVLEWNADPKNKEGLVVVAQYYGSVAVPGREKGKPAVANTDIIEVDNGRAVLDDAIWEGMPDTAIVYISILRGNVKLEKVDDQVIKFYAETHAEMPIILIKDLNTIAK